MAAFVLIHGSGQNASCWARVARQLEERGHAVAAPDLPKRAPDRGLADHAAVIARSAGKRGNVMVAHSFSGVFLPLLPALTDCSLLVFLAAVIPEPGKSTRDQLAEDASMFSPEWLEAGPRWFQKSEEESLARHFLLHDCDEETVGWALGTLEMCDTRHLVTEPLPLADWPDVPAASIVATEDRTLSPDWCRRTTRRVLGREPLEVEAGHCPQVSRPTGVARLLEQLASDPAGNGAAARGTG